MDKLRKLFHLKDRKAAEEKIGEPQDKTPLATPPQSPNPKRRRGKDETAFTGSPKKKFRTISPDLSPQNEKPRVSNLSGTTPRGSMSSATQAEPPKLEWKPMSTDLSSIFEDVSAEPRPRPLKQQPDQANGQLSTAAKRRSLPPQAIFAKAAKDFSDIPALTTANGAGNHPYSTQHHAMTLDDLLTQPLFGKPQPTAT